MKQKIIKSEDIYFESELRIVLSNKQDFLKLSGIYIFCEESTNTYYSFSENSCWILKNSVIDENELLDKDTE